MRIPPVRMVFAILILCLVLPGWCVAQQADPGAKVQVCPRCGYIADAGWRYCAACGWDLRLLAGPEGAAKLKSIGASVVGVTVVKEAPGIEEVLPPRIMRQLYAYSVTYRRSKQFATAVPFLKPGIFVTSARSLEWVEIVDVRTYNNRIIPAQVLGYDIPSGIGVIQAEVPGAVPLPVSSLVPKDADPTWVLCFPVLVTDEKVEYLPESFHHGSISAVGQDGIGLAAFENLLRTDHSIEDGCRGGALLDAYGRGAGVVLGQPDPGITFAAPLSDIQAIVEVLAEKKKPERPYFGMGLIAPDDRRRAKFHLPQESTLPLVAYLIPDSPASKAGLQPGDLLTSVGGQKISTVAGAGALLLKASPAGQAVSLMVRRGAEEKTLSVLPAKRPDRILLLPSDEIQEHLQANLIEVDTGSTSQQGLRVANLLRGGRGEKDGYREGDLIVSAYGKPVRHLSVFDEIVQGTNSHIFGAKSKDSGSARVSTYYMSLAVRSADKGEKEERPYVNLFPDALSAPVY